MIAVLLALTFSHVLGGPHPNPYHILGVSRTASIDELKTAFRNLAKKWHPDKSSAVEIFPRLQQAYEVLRNADKRNYYDRIGRYPPSQQAHLSVDIQNHSIQRYAAVGALHLYHRDPDRFSPSTLLVNETYSFFVEDDVFRFGTLWIVKLYANHCNGCSTISSVWESLISEYQGWASFGRINFDLSAGLVRALDLRSIPEIFAVTRSRDGRGVTLTPLLNGDLNRLSKRSFSQILSSIPRPNDFTLIESRDDYDKFLSSSSNDIKVTFCSRSFKDVPVSLLALIFRTDLPKHVKYAFAGNTVAVTSGTDTESVLIRRGDQEEIISELSDWDRLISVDSGSWLVSILKKHTLPLFAKLTRDNFYDICYANDPACVVIVTNQEPIAFRYFEGLRDLVPKLKFSHSTSRIRIGWIHSGEQSNFVQQLGLSSSIRNHNVGFCVIRPGSQASLIFEGSGSNPNDFDQIQAWITSAVKEIHDSEIRNRSAIPFLQPEPNNSSFFSSWKKEFSNWIWFMFTVLLYGVFTLAGILLLFIGPSLM